jgi:membrane protease YdiL (CAAX protease family)
LAQGSKKILVVNLWTIVALLVALGGPPLFVLVPEKLFGPSPRLGVQFVLHVGYCGLILFIVWVVRTKERLPLSSIGIRTPNWATVGTGILIVYISVLLLPIITVQLQGALGADVQTTTQQLAALPVWFRLILAVTGGIVEETLYRGYAIERIATISGQLWIGAAVSIIAFTLAHIPAWGWRFAIAADLPFALLATALYLWRRDLIANMIAHVIGLIVALLTLPRI